MVAVTYILVINHGAEERRGKIESCWKWQKRHFVSRIFFLQSQFSREQAIDVKLISLCWKRGNRDSHDNVVSRIIFLRSWFSGVGNVATETVTIMLSLESFSCEFDSAGKESLLWWGDSKWSLITCAIDGVCSVSSKSTRTREMANSRWWTRSWAAGTVNSARILGWHSYPRWWTRSATCATN